MSEHRPSFPEAGSRAGSVEADILPQFRVLFRNSFSHGFLRGCEFHCPLPGTLDVHNRWSPSQRLWRMT